MRTHSTLRLIVAGATATLLGAGARLVPLAQGVPDAVAWSVHYSLSGGFAGLSRGLTLTSAGQLTAQDRRVGSASTTAPADLVIAVGKYLASAREPRGSDSNARLPDLPRITFTATRAGREQQPDLTTDFASQLDRAIDAAFERTIVGSWWQSAWKLCSPAAAITAADIDPSIEELVLSADGRFSVRWPDGPRTTDIPHQPVPDYSSRYQVLAASARIEFQVEDPGHALPDFAGAGTFAFDGDRLALRQVWFGTRRAPHKPDVCEITFTRTSTHPSS